MTRHPGSSFLFTTLLALLAACSENPAAPVTPTGPGEPVEVASVQVAPGSLALPVGATALLTARPLDARGAVLGGYTVAWTSDDTAVVTVSATGRVSARGAGAAFVRASTAGRTGAVRVQVTADEPTDPTDPTPEPLVAWIQITPTGGLLSQALGTSRQLGVIARASNGTEIVGRPVEWSSANEAVATVSAAGLLEARAVGTAWVKAVVDGRRDSTLVAVPTLIARIELDSAALDLGVGDVRRLVATAVDAQGNPLSRTFAWSSSNAAVATVDADGRIVATGAGSALVTATSEGRTASARITVTGRQLRLIDAGGAPLPAILDTITIPVNGVARTVAFQATGGTLRMRDGRYELVVVGLLVADGHALMSASVVSVGVMAYDVYSGDPLFFEGDEWVNQQPRFRGRMRGENGLVLDWNREPGRAVVPLGFAR